ncbi:MULTISPECIES: hypothetical protein [Carnobacterium]|uniref:Uncharacterized protein n=1 Tax=Carnobacterium antarcticum TaxID=2126436 RepID=A0ABW4NQJ1_9LACT|nr:MULTISPECIES: hypothetical protein [unclassified Carnobacterium]ALV22291.1 small membrane protein [Carnobacterium sp. CP1]QQP70240.1 hypothetical protein JHE06_11815 [Carnobacterium sp. CS13]
MKEAILLLAKLVNEVHDVLAYQFGVRMTDKDLHFWVMGIIGIIFFLFVYVFFKAIEKMKFSTTILAFIYTFTMMVVLVFAIEIQQAITNRGNMEFADAAIGLWGFLVFFFGYALFAGIVYSVVRSVRKMRKQPEQTEKQLEIEVEDKPTRRYRTEKRKNKK